MMAVVAQNRKRSLAMLSKSGLFIDTILYFAKRQQKDTTNPGKQNKKNEQRSRNLKRGNMCRKQWTQSPCRLLVVRCRVACFALLLIFFPETLCEGVQTFVFSSCLQELTIQVCLKHALRQKNIKKWTSYSPSIHGCLPAFFHVYLAKSDEGHTKINTKNN